MIFSYFKVPGELQHRVLFLGVLGAILMRGSLILLESNWSVHFTRPLYFRRRLIVSV